MEKFNIDAQLLTAMFVQGTRTLTNNKEAVNALNVFPVPDGDTGTNMSLTMATAVEKLGGKHETVEDVAKAISKGSLMGARGNSGVILSQIFRGFAKGCKNKKILSPKEFCIALRDAQEAAYSAVLKPVEGTILTVIREIAEKAKTLEKEKLSINKLLQKLIDQGEEALAKTPEMLPVLKQAGVVDSGGKGLMFFFYGMMDAVEGKVVELVETKQSTVHSQFKTEDITFAYCTEFIVEGQDIDGAALRAKIEPLGDSMVFVQDEELVKVHIHTNNPGIALEAALAVGSLKKVKIENMREQHSELLEHGVDYLTANPNTGMATETENAGEEQQYAFVAVAAGQGFADILKDLGVDRVIQGGQTMNPSTQDFLDAIATLKANHIFLFPNNSNIIMAAQQAKELSEGDIHVIPTKTIPQCIASMIHFDNAVDAETNHQSMSAALSGVSTLSVTHSVRDTTMDDLTIKEGDFIAVLGSEIVTTGESMIDVAFRGLERAVKEDSELISVYYGEEMTEQATQELVDMLQEKYEDMDVAVFYGGQPVYYFVISVE